VEWFNKSAFGEKGAFELFDLIEDPGEQNNLVEQYPEKVEEMIQKMNQEFQSMGELPPSLVIRTDADNSHYEYLEQKHANK